MPELKPIEVIMKLDFAESNGLEIVAHAEQVSELVRCKDCTYFNHVKCQEERAGLCEHFDTYMYISDYCSDGYRRADNG